MNALRRQYQYLTDDKKGQSEYFGVSIRIPKRWLYEILRAAIYIGVAQLVAQLFELLK